MALEHGQVVINLCDDEDEVLPQRKLAPAHMGQPSVKQRSKESRPLPEIVDISRSSRSPERDLASHARRRDFQSLPHASTTSRSQRGARKPNLDTSATSPSSRSAERDSSNSRTLSGPITNALKDRATSRPSLSSRSSPTPRSMADAASGPLRQQKRLRENADSTSDGGRPEKRQRSLHVVNRSGQDTTKNGAIPSSWDKPAKHFGRKPPSSSTNEVVDLTEDAEVATPKTRVGLARSTEPLANGRRGGVAYGDGDNLAHSSPSSQPQHTSLRDALLRTAAQHEAERRRTNKGLSESRSSPVRKKLSRHSTFQKDGNEGTAIEERDLEIPESPLGRPEIDRTAKYGARDNNGSKGATGSFQDPASTFKAAPKSVTRLASESSPGPVPWPNKTALPLTPSESSADEEARRKEWPTKRPASPAKPIANATSQSSKLVTKEQRFKDHEHTASQRPGAASTGSPSRQSTVMKTQAPQHLPTSTVTAKESVKESRSNKVAEKVQDASPADRSLTSPTKITSKTLDTARESQTPEARPSLQQVKKTTSSSDANITNDRSFASVASEMSVAKQIERVMGHCLDELHRDNEHWTRTELRRARYAPEGRQRIAPEQPTSVFSKMTPLAVKLHDKKKTDKTFAKLETEFARGGKKSTWLTPCTTFRTNEEDVPPYSHFVKLKHNFLAPNDTTLQHWPYFDDEINSRPQFGDQFKRLYKMDMAFRESKLLLMMKAENFAEQAEHMLQEIQCEWADVLHFLLDANPEVCNDLEARMALLSRDASGDVKAFRESKRWASVRDKLPEAEPAKTAKVALLCEQFYKVAGFSFWHVARRSDYIRSLLESKTQSHNLDKLTCRVCMRLSCPYHGEIDNPDEDSDSEAGSVSAEHSTEHSDVETDIINPKKKNCRTRVGLPASLEEDTATGKDRRYLHYWQSGPNASLKTRPDERHPFYPCHHPGQTCGGAQCSCHTNKVPCEKSCACSPACTRKFQGCNCAKKGKVCFNADNCACFQLGRECDPDLCGSCGVRDVLDPMHSHDDRVLVDRCRNANIQRGRPKHTMLGKSLVHGFGLYACELIREHEFIGEYKGEVITTKEAERRGAVYEHQKLSYLFTLNQSQEVDSTFFGNKMRFINHSTKAKCNVYARIIMVNTVHRISLFAGRDINPGDELAFNYGPMFPMPDGQEGGGKNAKTKDGSQSKSVPHVRNANLTKSFYDPDLDGDERGGRAAQKSHGRPPKADRGRLGAAQIRRLLSSSSDVEMADPDDGDDDYEGSEVDEDDYDDDLYP